MRPSSLGLATIAGVAYGKQPNILFILTDDQDLHMESVDHMQYLKADIVDKGVTFAQHYCTVALCCPSRATLWTGKAAHNHNVTNVSPPYGGYPKVAEVGVNDDNLFLWMQDAGYNTYYAGKLWNFHGVYNYDDPYARGFNGSDFLLDPYTYRYWDSKMTHNGEPPVSYAGRYSTDVVAEKAEALLDEALSHEGEGKPWFLTVAPIAPHSNWVLDEKTNTTYLSTPQSAYRHEHLFHDYQIPRGPSFNTPIRGAPSWVGDSLSPLNESVLLYNDHYQRQRLRSLQAVDEMLHNLIIKIEDAGRDVIENTYIFYSTDNGYHISQHGMHPGKECGYDTDIHIPMFVRGPGFDTGGVVDSVTTHTDIAPTILELAGVLSSSSSSSSSPSFEKVLDGESMLPPPSSSSSSSSASSKPEHAAIEYWGYAVPEGHYGFRSDGNFEAGPMDGKYGNNTYRGLRLVSSPPPPPSSSSSSSPSSYSLYYSVWCTGEKELYNLLEDPEQTVNLLSSSSSSLFSSSSSPSEEIEKLVHRLDALIMVLKHCSGKACSRPWGVLHPAEGKEEGGEVKSLGEAMDGKYDEFYKGQPRMWFRECGEGFLRGMESGEEVNRYIGGVGAGVDDDDDADEGWEQELRRR